MAFPIWTVEINAEITVERIEACGHDPSPVSDPVGLIVKPGTGGIDHERHLDRLRPTRA